jgi:hypothetical protein
MSTRSLATERFEQQSTSYLSSALLSADGLYRGSGAALLLGGAVGTVVHAIHPDGPETPSALAGYIQSSQPVHLLLFLSILLILLGLPALLARQIGKVGITGLIGFVLLFLGLPLVDLWHSVIEVGMLPALVAQIPEQTLEIVAIADADPLSATLQMAGAPLVLLGSLLLAIATIRAQMMRTWPAWILVSFVVVAVAAFFPILPWVLASKFPVLFYLAITGFGMTLLLDRQSIVSQ